MSRGPFQPANTISVPSVTALTTLTIADVPVGTVATTLDTGATYVIGGDGTWAAVSGASATQTILERAQELLGSTVVKTMGTDFDNDQWYRTAGTSGTITPSVTKKGGVVTLSTTATANRVAAAMPHGTINLLDNASTSRFYVGARFSVTSAVNADSGGDLRLTAVTIGQPQIILGVVGSLSSTFFAWAVQNDAGALTASGVTTVPVDTAMHVWEIASDGTTITFYIDGVSVASCLANLAGANPCTPTIIVSNGAGGGARTIDADYLYICTGLPA